MTLRVCLEAQINEIHGYLSQESEWIIVRGRRYLSNDTPNERAAQFKRTMEHVSQRLGQLLDRELGFIHPWVPATSDRRMKEHFANLKIPTLDGKPSLLCHGLGEPTAFDFNTIRPRSQSAGHASMTRSSREHLFESVFPTGGSSLDLKHSVLFNTSGAGKTRLVLEGLCREWGFYLTCSRQASQCGSADIEYVLDWPHGHLNACGIVEHPTDDQTVLCNEKMAQTCFDAILAARLLVLLCLLAAYEDRVGGLFIEDIPHLKKYWLFVQLDNRILADKNCPDLFLELSTLLCHTKISSASTAVNYVLSSIFKSFLGDIDTRIYCVLDEAQIAADAYPDAFRDSLRKNSRPALRAMLKVWLDHGMRHVITGTSLNLEHINDAISSTVGKYANKLKEAVTDTGSFVDDDDQIEKFLRYYLPSSYLDSPSGKELLKRAKYWLRGRPRFIASYVAYLIEHDLQSPHQTLTKYIKTMTDFAPVDGEFWEKLEAPMPGGASLPIKPFNFSRAGNLRSDLAEAVKKLVCHRLINGRTDFERSGAGLVEVDLVECGFARYPSAADRPVFDEPLAYLAADFWITAHRKSKHAYFVERIHQNALNSNGLEQYTAICLAHVFRDYTPLSAYFDFARTRSNRRLADKKARLVSCWIDSSGSFRVAPVFSPFEISLDNAGRATENASSPANILGYNSKDLWEDLLWLEFRLDAPFLFPQNEFGPDLIFRLQLEGGELLTVALQTKYKEYASSLEDPFAIQSAVDSVNPDRFYRNKRGQPHVLQELPQRVLNALDQLPNRYCADQQGYHSVLCGLFACPIVSISGSKLTYKKILQEIESGCVTINPGHEFFMVKFDAIQELTRNSKPREALGRLADALRGKKKEKLYMQGEMNKKKLIAKLTSKKCPRG